MAVTAPTFGDWDPSYQYMPGVSSGGGSAPSSSGLGKADFISMLTGGASNFLTSLFAMKNANKQAQLNRQQQTNLQTNQNATSTAADTQALASKESTLDPFRSRMSQVGDAAKLDRVANATSTPRRLNVGGPFAGFVPQSTGGYSYQKSPALVQAAKDAQTSVLSGTSDPSMTNTANYGKTGALDLLSTAAGTKNAASPDAMASGAPAAGSSLGADPAANAIRQAFMAKFGRNPTDAEIQALMGGGPMSPTDPKLAKIVSGMGASPSGGFTPSYMGAG